MCCKDRRWVISLSLACTLWMATHQELSVVEAAQPGGELEVCTGQIGLCSSGPSAMVTDQMRQTWHAAVGPDDVTLEWEADPCSIPGATCLAPVPASIRLVGLDVVADERISEPKTFAQLLQDWAVASRSLLPVSERDVAWMLRMNAPALSAHVIDLVAELLGPVDPVRLQRDYSWVVERQGDFGVWLVAVPQDDTVRLFCSKLRIGLTRFSEIAALTVSDRNGEWQIVSLPAPVERPLLVEIDFDGVPPSPRPAPGAQAPLIRFAAGTIEIEIDLE